MVKIEELPIKNLLLNYGLYGSEIKQDADSITIFNKFVDDHYWNYVYLYEENQSALERAKDYFHSKSFPLAVYFLTSNLKEEFLKRNNLELSFQDAIMIFKGEKIEQNEELEIKEISTEKEKNDFVKVYKEVFVAKGDDVYSGCSEGYLDCLNEYFKNYPMEGKSDLVAYKDGEPVGIITIAYDDNYALILNVAVVIPARKIGVCKSLAAEAIKRFKDKIIFLGTEKDSINENIYKKMGFETVAVGECWIEENKNKEQI